MGAVHTLLLWTLQQFLPGTSVVRALQFYERYDPEGRLEDKHWLDVRFSHFHNGFLNAWVETGIFGALALAAIFVVAAWLAVRTLARATSADAKLGGVMLLVVVTTYPVSGMTGILVGHDITDAMLVAFLAVGAYLAAGTSMLEPEASSHGPAGDESAVRAEIRSAG